MSHRRDSMINDPHKIQEFAQVLGKLSKDIGEDMAKLNRAKKQLGETFKDRHYDNVSEKVDDKSARLKELSQELDAYSKHLLTLYRKSMTYLNSQGLRD